MENRTLSNKPVTRFAHALARICAPVSVNIGPEGQRFLTDSFSGHMVSRVSPRYTVVQNKDVFGPFVERFGEDNIKRLQTQGRGQYAHMTIDTGREFSLSYNGETDIIRERLIVENSYNKTRSFRFMFGAFRRVCSNGLYTGQSVLAIRRIHAGSIDVGGIVHEVLANYEKNSFELWRDFQAQPMDLQEENKLVEAFQAFDPGPDEKPNACARQSNRWIRQCAFNAINRPESLDNQRNAWGLLNGINRGIASVLRTPGAFSRLISANQAAEAHVSASIQRAEALPV